MLQENEEILKRYQQTATLDQTKEFKGKLNQIKSAQSQYIKHQIKKYVLIVCSCAVLYFILFHPVQSGNMIGQWIHDFFGTIINKQK